MHLRVQTIRTEKILSTHKVKGGTLHTVLTKSGEVQLDDNCKVPCGRIPAFGIKKYKVISERQFKHREKQIAELERRLKRVNFLLANGVRNNSSIGMGKDVKKS